METLFSDLSLWQWLLLCFCALLSGMSKVGVPGVSMIVVPVLALAFGGKPSTGMLLPILMVGDLFGVLYYRRHAEWLYVLKVIPWAFAGIGLALWVGELVNDAQFKNLIAIQVFIGIGLMLWRERRNKSRQVSEQWWFAAFMGVLGGFATMIGNVAGPIFAIYLLAMRLPKNTFIGTAAWFFFIVNYSKFPLQMFVWKSISLHTLAVDLVTIPAIGLGAFLGFRLVKILPEKTYRTFVFIITALSAFLLLI